MGMNKALRMMMMNRNGKNHEESVENKEKKLDKGTAEKWVKSMINTDGEKGGKWSYEQTTQVMTQKGFECDPVDFFVAMNAIYSDYGKTFAKHGITSPEIYAEIAYDWVKDPDAKENKASRYYEYIAK